MGINGVGQLALRGHKKGVGIHDVDAVGQPHLELPRHRLIILPGKKQLVLQRLDDPPLILQLQVGCFHFDTDGFLQIRQFQLHLAIPDDGLPDFGPTETALEKRVIERRLSIDAFTVHGTWYGILIHATVNARNGKGRPIPTPGDPDLILGHLLFDFHALHLRPPGPADGDIFIQIRQRFINKELFLEAKILGNPHYPGQDGPGQIQAVSGLYLI